MVSPVWVRRVTPKGTRTHKSAWVCECGKEFVASENNVRRGHTKSCGCKSYENVGGKVVHGHYIGNKPTPTYSAWQSMIARCCNPKDQNYFRYGGAGVKVWKEWREGFPAFLNDMGERPADDLSLDRYPNPFGHYEPKNCRWATRTEQARNRRDNFHKFEPERADDYVYEYQKCP